MESDYQAGIDCWEVALQLRFYYSKQWVRASYILPFKLASNLQKLVSGKLINQVIDELQNVSDTGKIRRKTKGKTKGT